MRDRESKREKSVSYDKAAVGKVAEMCDKVKQKAKSTIGENGCNRWKKNTQQDGWDDIWLLLGGLAWAGRVSLVKF